VVYEVEVRRFFCEGRDCKHDIFCERLGEVASSYSRRTKRLDEMLTQLGLLFSAEVGARFVGITALELSPDTLLRLVRKGFAASESENPDVRHIGLDDWAFLKGQNYGTLIVDHDKHRPIALLPDREVETVKAWLVKHPKIEVVTRDRYQGYARGCA
jgi:hypothetical protein